MAMQEIPSEMASESAVRMDPPHTFRRIPLRPHQLLSRITEQRDLFVLAHVGVPRIDAERWVLHITGLVRTNVAFTFEQIRRMPKKEVESFHQCAGYPSNPKIATRRIGNVVWGGVELKALLNEIGVLPNARFLWSYGSDYGEYEGIAAAPYLKDCPLERLETGDILLAYEINGEPLDPEHGFPLRLFIPGFYGTNCVKWLSRLHLADRRAESPFTTRFYNDPGDDGPRPVWQIAPESVIVNPGPDAKLGPQPVEIWGWAWADGGVAGVALSANGGQDWFAAEVEAGKGRSWQKFRGVWCPQGEGEAVLVSRATAANGLVQPLTEWRNCVHSVRAICSG